MDSVCTILTIFYHMRLFSYKCSCTVLHVVRSLELEICQLLGMWSKLFIQITFHDISLQNISITIICEWIEKRGNLGAENLLFENRAEKWEILGSPSLYMKPYKGAWVEG